jgi:tetratricopeptide (TPR) repeat protein
MDLVEDAKKKARDIFLSGDLTNAEALYLKIMDRAVNDSEVLMTFGNIQMQKGLKGVALQFYMRAVQADPKNLSAQFNMACALFQCKQIDEADKIYAALDKTFEQLFADPNVPMEHKIASKAFAADVYGNWSALYVNNGTPSRAVELGLKGLGYNPDHPHACNHVSLGLMEQGKWAEAWPYWERRYRLHQMNKRNYHQVKETPQWDGKTKIDVLAIHGEQGLGDELLFLTALKDVIDSGLVGKILIETASRLTPLIQRSFPLADCFPTHNDLMQKWHDKVDAKLPMGSLFPLYRPTPDACPGRPYLIPSAIYRDEYRDRLNAMGPGLKVGITWRGGTEKTHEDVRKVTLEKWKPILDVPGVKFLGLQYTEGADAEADRLGIPQWKLAIDDLDRQAALIAELDLVISVCQTVIHFAGALGKECWVLTPSRPRWCYLKDRREDMPVYSSVKLYRQKNDNWPDVIERVAADLRSKTHDLRRDDLGDTGRQMAALTAGNGHAGLVPGDGIAVQGTGNGVATGGYRSEEVAANL